MLYLRVKWDVGNEHTLKLCLEKEEERCINKNRHPYENFFKNMMKIKDMISSAKIKKIVEHCQEKNSEPVRIRLDRKKEGKIALIGWSLASIEAADKLNLPFLVVSLPEFEHHAKKHGIPFVGWDFEREIEMEEVFDRSEALYKTLSDRNVDYAIPLFEETVEWAGALNARFRNDPRIFDHSLLFRNKAMMKRRALLGGLNVGVFEEGKDKDDVRRFFQKVNHALLKYPGGDPDPVHVKALGRAGAAGHRIIRSEDDIDYKLTDENFPCLLESHLPGTEVSCEAFVYQGEVKFLNITEYVVFGYSMMAPPSPEIEKNRERIRDEVQKVVDAFDIQYGVIHPEFFISQDGTLYFGEIAYRIPGGHIFELIQKTYRFSPFEGHLLCSDPNTSEAELDGYFPDEKDHKGHAGSLLVYPRVNYINGVNVPADLQSHPCFDRHTVFLPAERRVRENEGYGNHYGTVFFHGDDSEQVKQPLKDYVEHDFYY